MRKILLTAVLVLIGTMAFAQERIAVFPFEDMDNVFTRNESTMFYREFSNEFTNRSAGRFSVIPRQDIERLINTEAAFQLSDFSAREKTSEMGRVLNGSQILSGLIGKVGNNIRITVSLYTYPELQQLPGGATLSVSNKNELFSKIPELVRSMQSAITGRGTEQPVPEGLLYEITGGGVAITNYTGNATSVNIPSQIQGLLVWAIGDDAFLECESLTNVTIPPSVTAIGKEAFRTCNNLTNITIPPSVTAIGEGAFFQSGLTSITIPSSVTSIGYYAFGGCSSLTSITVDSRNPSYTSVDGVLFDKNIRTVIAYPDGKNTRYVIPSSITAIGDGAFWSCKSLTSITIPSSVTVIGDGAFYECTSLTNVTIPSSVTSIRGGAFMYCSSLSSITIPSSVTVIENHVFYHCDSLTSITIPSSVTSIGNEVFWYCEKLTNVNIPSSVTSIGDGTFAGCSNLTNVTLSRRTQVGYGTFPASTKFTYRD